MKTAIILGSSRKDGNTHSVVNYLAGKVNLDIIDLSEYTINYYSYENAHNDDFLPLIKRIITDYDTIVFASPIYWFSMSAIMKTFFDRLTELLRTEKELGRKLRGKNAATLACGSDESGVPGFFIAFEKSARYLGMNYLQSIHTWKNTTELPTTVREKLDNFAELI